MARGLDINLNIFQTNIRVVYGDLTDFDTDIIVSADDTLLLASSGVSKRIREKAGKRTIQREIHKHDLPIPVGSVIVTSGGNLRAKYIFHAAALELGFRKQSRPREVITNIVQNTINLAEALKAKRIITPLLVTCETGPSGESAIVSQLSGLSEATLLDLILRSLAYYIATLNHPVSLCEIVIVLYEAPEFQNSGHEQQIIKDLQQIQEEVDEWAKSLKPLNKWVLQAKSLVLAMKDENDTSLYPALEEKLKSALDHLSRIFNDDKPLASGTTSQYHQESPNLQFIRENEYIHQKNRLSSALKNFETDIEGIQKEISGYCRRRVILEENAAIHGIDVPADTIIEIQDIEDKLVQLNQELSSQNERWDKTKAELAQLEQQGEIKPNANAVDPDSLER